MHWNCLKCKDGDRRILYLNSFILHRRRAPNLVLVVWSILNMTIEAQELKTKHKLNSGGQERNSASKKPARYPEGIN